MSRIGILSDTHGYFHPELPRIFKDCDEIWHCGDFGTLEVVRALRAIAPLRGVYGNIDGQETRSCFPEYNRFKCEGIDVLITHIGGYPGNYSPKVMDFFKVKPPGLLVCGHSHILKVIHDNKNDLLYINPGAAGKSGFHKVITMIRLTIEKEQMKDLEVVEFEK